MSTLNRRRLGAVISENDSELETAHTMALSKPVGRFNDDLVKLVIHPSHNGNVIYSPLSLSTALSILMVGAGKDTESQLRHVLHLDMHVTEAAVDERRTSEHQKSKNVTSLGNLLLISQSYAPCENFKQTAIREYKSDVSIVDFQNHQLVLKKLHHWICEHTNEKTVEKYLKKVPFSKSVLVLINSMYFKLIWHEKLSSRVLSMNFYPTKEIGKQVTFICIEGQLKYADITYGSDLMKLVEVPLEGQANVLFLLPPTSKTVNELVASHSMENLHEKFVKDGHRHHMKLCVPEFEFKGGLNMNDSLKQIGIGNIFKENSADLTGISNIKKAFVTEIQHLTTLKVERKLESNRMSTHFSMGTYETKKESAPVPELVLNRPFIFIIYDSTNKLPIFTGKLEDSGP